MACCCKCASSAYRGREREGGREGGSSGGGGGGGERNLYLANHDSIFRLELFDHRVELGHAASPIFQFAVWPQVPRILRRILCTHNHTLAHLT
jgi:hypothetical protein